MYVCLRFHEIPAKGLQDIKETKCYGRDGRRENSIPPYNFVIAGGINIIVYSYWKQNRLFILETKMIAY